MQKISTLFIRNPQDRQRLTREVHPRCRWVIDGEGVPTRKYDGKCLFLDDAGDWWARIEIKPDVPPPPHFCLVATDPVTGIHVGATPIAESPFATLFDEALRRYDGTPAYGSYELFGPGIKGNPEKVDAHHLIHHADAPPLDNSVRTYDELRDYLSGLSFEGIVWRHVDGRLAKIKRRDVMDAPPHESPSTHAHRHAGEPAHHEVLLERGLASQHQIGGPA